LSPFSHFSADKTDVEQLAERMTLLGLEAAQAAHKVEKVEVNYSRAAKQVDVKALKELMWSGLNTVAVGGKNDCVDFDQVLATVPSDNPAGRVEDLSVHLCFICMLHLANEHGLQIQGTEGLDALSIRGVVSDWSARFGK
jgi:condensin complex subunit 2